MSATGLDVFDSTIHLTNQWLKEIMEELGWRDRLIAYRALRATLHALRNRLTVDEVAQFSAHRTTLALLARSKLQGNNPCTMWARTCLRCRQREAVSFTVRAAIRCLSRVCDKTVPAPYGFWRCK